MLFDVHSIRNKLFLSFGAVLFLLLIQSLFGVHKLDELSNSYQDNMERLDKIRNLRQDADAVHLTIFKYLGTLDPEAMENLKLQVSDLLVSMATVTAELQTGVEVLGLLSEDYQKVIDSHFNFQTKRAVERMNSSAQKYYEDMVQSIDARQQEIEQVVAQQTLEVKRAARVQSYGLLVFGVFIAVVMAIYLANSIARPLKHVMRMADAMSRGDLTQDLKVKQKGEIGELVSSLNRMAENLRDMIRGIAQSANSVAGSAERLMGSSHNMQTVIDETRSQTHSASAAAEQLSQNINGLAAIIEETSANMTGVADSSQSVSQSVTQVDQAAGAINDNMVSLTRAADEMSRSVQSVAVAIEEMSSSQKEVSRNVSRAATVAREAKQATDDTSHTIRDLGESAKDIGKVIEVIKGIAAQTNLLALNATIEAAGAGAAGKGFAVVANEIKELANQTAQATEEIRTFVLGMQNNSQAVIDAISSISGVIEEMDSISTTIAAAIEEQTTTTAEISRSVAHSAERANEVSQSVGSASEQTTVITERIQSAAQGVKEIAVRVDEVSRAGSDGARNASQAASAANEVSRNVDGVRMSADRSAEQVTEARQSADELAELATSLKSIVDRFRV